MPGVGGRYVGRAEVIIHADTRSLHDDIKRGLEGEAGTAEKAGQNTADDYVKGLRDRYEKSQGLGEATRNEIDKERPRIADEGSRIGDDFGTKLRQSLEQHMKGALPEEDFRRMITGIQDADKVLQHFNGTQDQAKASTDRVIRSNHDWTNSLGSLMGDLDSLVVRVKDTSGANDDMIIRLKRSEEEIKKVGKATKDTERDWGKLFGKGSRNDFLNWVGSVMGGLIGVSTKLPLVNKLFGFLDKGISGLFKEGGRLEGFFGKLEGSSNGLISSFGSLGSSLTSKLAPAMESVATNVGTFGVALLVISTLLSPIISGISLLAGAATALAAALTTGLIGALGAAAPLLGGLVAGMGVFALAIHGVQQAGKGANSALTTANTNVAKAKQQVDAATPGTKAYTTAQQGLNKALKDQAAAQKVAGQGIGGLLQNVKQYFTQISRVAAVHVFANLPQDWKIAQPFLHQARTAVARIGDAIGTVIDGFSRMLSSASFRRFMQTFNQIMPDIVRRLGSAFTHFISGAAGMFRALLPWGDRLATAIQHIAQHFDDWANSTRGQSAIGRFMKTAWQDAKDLWDILVQVGRIIGELMSGGQQTGQSFLQSIAGGLEHFANYLASGKGQKAMKRWFDDARRFMGAVFTLLGQIGQWFDKLDTKRGRQQITDFMSTLGDLVHIISVVMGALAKVGGPFLSAFMSGIKAISDLMSGNFKGLLGDMAGLGKDILQISGLMNLWDLVKGPLESFGKSVGHFFSTAWHWVAHAFSTWPGKIGNFFKELPGKALHLAGEWGPKLLGWVLGGIVGLFVGFATLQARALAWFAALPIRLLEKAGSLGLKLGHWIIQAIPRALGALANLGARMLHWFAQLPGKIGNFLSRLPGVIGRFLQRAAVAAGNFAAHIFHNVVDWIQKLPGRVGTFLAELPGKVSSWIGRAATTAGTWAARLVAKVVDWVKQLPGKVGTWLAQLPGKVGDWLGKAATTAGQKAADLVAKVGHWISSIPGKIGSWLAGVAAAFAKPFQDAYNRVTGIFGKIGQGISHVLGALNPFSAEGMVAGLQAGAVLRGPQLRLIGEAGPEAVVPLNRPLALVDPSVRNLSAIAQGLTRTNLTNATPRVQQNITLNVYPNQSDPRAVASAVINQAVALARV